ncbi:MAG: hypothetical protein J6C53_04280 [Clostridia bacterium]|nr:hypothetical protein [Clostridia bacterium]
MNTIQNDTERLKKEIWHLKKVVLPNLEEKISSGGGGGTADTGEIENEIENIKTRLNSLEAGFSSLSSSVETNCTAIGALDDEISALQNTTTSQGESISNLSNSLDEVTDAQTNCTQRLEEVESTQTSHAKEYQTLKKRVDGHDSDVSFLVDQTDVALMLIDDNFNRILTAENDIVKLKKQITELGNSSGGGDTSELQSKITALEGRVTALETTVASHTSSISLIDEDLYLIKGMLGI